MCADLKTTYDCGHSTITIDLCDKFKNKGYKILQYRDCPDYKGYSQTCKGSCGNENCASSTKK
jgi:cobyrinic acid a,c-diamide synthase